MWLLNRGFDFLGTVNCISQHIRLDFITITQSGFSVDIREPIEKTGEKLTELQVNWLIHQKNLFTRFQLRLKLSKPPDWIFCNKSIDYQNRLLYLTIDDNLG